MFSIRTNKNLIFLLCLSVFRLLLNLLFLLLRLYFSFPSGILVAALVLTLVSENDNSITSQITVHFMAVKEKKQIRKENEENTIKFDQYFSIGTKVIDFSTNVVVPMYFIETNHFSIVFNEVLSLCVLFCLPVSLSLSLALYHCPHRFQFHSYFVQK